MSCADGRGAARDPWVAVGLLGAALGLGVVFVHVPATLWAGNVAEFHFPFTSFLASGATAFVAGLVLAGGALVVTPRRAQAVAACVMAAVGVLVWFYADVLVAPMRALDGLNAPMAFDRWPGVWELPLTAMAAAALAAGIGCAGRTAAIVLLVLNLALAFVTTATLLEARSRPLRAPLSVENGDVFRFASTGNVLVLLLDGLQSDVADRVLRADPELARRLDGFSFYHDAASAAPTTFLNIPAIHSGTAYAPGEMIPVYFTEAIAHRSFITRFAAAGYDTTLVNPIEGICPDRVDTCTSTARLLRPPAALLLLETSRLLDLSLFRVAPFWIKRGIYNEGRWLSAGRVLRAARVDPSEVNRTIDAGEVLESVRFFDEAARRFTVDSPRPTLKFFHTFVSHPPYLLGDGCRAGDAGLERVTSQARCALLAAATLLDRLKQAGIYDSSVILIVADHGVNLVGLFNDDAPGSPLRWQHLSAAAHPVFLLKPRGARGAVRDAAAPVYVADVGATLCAATAACAVTAGIPAGQAAVDRRRRFYEYVWRHEYWRRHDVPDLTPHDIRGPVWDANAWLSTPDAAVKRIRAQ